MKTVESKIAPNPKEAQYWVDLSVDPSGGIIKHYKHGEWSVINLNEAQDLEIDKLESAIDQVSANLTTEIKNRQNSDSAVQAKIPTKVSQLTNDSGYLKAVPSEYITESELNAKGYLTAVPSQYITESELNAKGYLTSVPSTYITEDELAAEITALNSTIAALTERIAALEAA